MEEVFLVFESSSIEAMTWTSEGYDLTRAETLLALWPLPSKTQRREAEAPLSLMVSLAGRAQVKDLSSESRTCLIYLRVGWCKTKPWPSSVYSHCPLVQPVYGHETPRLQEILETEAVTLGGAHLDVGQLLASPQTPFPSEVWG